MIDKRRPHRWSGEQGSITTFVVLLVVPMIMMAGLAFDGGRILTGRREAFDIAQNAALAGAQAIDGRAIRQGEVSVDFDLVDAAATQYLADRGHTGKVSFTATEVSVEVTQQVDMRLLSVIGVGPKTVVGVATSRLVRGVEGPDT